MDEKSKDILPENFGSLEEATEFWESHSLADYWDETQAVDIEVRAPAAAMDSSGLRIGPKSGRTSPPRGYFRRNAGQSLGSGKVTGWRVGQANGRSPPIIRSFLNPLLPTRRPSSLTLPSMSGGQFGRQSQGTAVFEGLLSPALLTAVPSHYLFFFAIRRCRQNKPPV